MLHIFSGTPWLLLAFVLLPTTQAQAASESGSELCSTVEVFHRDGCPHCERAFDFLEGLQSEHPTVSVSALEISRSSEARTRFIALNQRFGVERSGVPSFLICDRFLVGFDAPGTTGAEIKRLMGLDVQAVKADQSGGVQTAWFGVIHAERLGLPLFTLAMGLVDGFNPCAMWVLLFLLSLLVNLRDRRRIILVAGTFVFVSGAVYFAFMAAWLNVFLIIGFSRALQVGVGLLAMAIGVVHVKDFFALHEGVSLSIPEAAKPRLYTRVRHVLQAENLTGALIGVTVVAVLVNLIELACTAGLPAVYTQILVSNELDTASYYAYLLLYNMAYIFDDALMVAIVVYTLSRRKLKETQGRWLKLISGSVIIVLGMLLVFVPHLLF